MELQKLGCDKLEVEDPSLSGAYIRSLVKQLTSKDTTTTMKTNVEPGCVVDSNVSSPNRNLRKQGKVLGTRHQAQQQIQQQQHKKQVRRRLHTSRPYQERLLNMAEARKEIVTALKFHRAAMKQATEQKQQQQQEEAQEQQQLSVSHQPSFEQDGRFKSRRNPRIYPSCRTSFSNYMNENDFSCSSFSIPNYYTWPVVSPIAPPPVVAENPNLTLPNQTLGLNLNLHDFNNLDATLFLNNHNNNNKNSSFCSYSSPTYSASPPLSVVTDQEIPTIGISQGEGVSSLADTIESSSATTQVSGGLHATMDDEGMAEMRSLGEQYQMEWNDTMNLITSARWSKFLKNMEHGAAHEVKNEDDANHCMFDELIEFPAWLNANDNCLEQCLEDYFKDPSLPCMDIGDIEFEAKDEEWLV